MFNRSQERVAAFYIKKDEKEKNKDLLQAPPTEEEKAAKLFKKNGL